MISLRNALLLVGVFVIGLAGIYGAMLVEESIRRDAGKQCRESVVSLLWESARLKEELNAVYNRLHACRTSLKQAALEIDTGCRIYVEEMK